MISNFDLSRDMATKLGSLICYIYIEVLKAFKIPSDIKTHKKIEKIKKTFFCLHSMAEFILVFNFSLLPTLCIVFLWKAIFLWTKVTHNIERIFLFKYVNISVNMKIIENIYPWAKGKIVINKWKTKNVSLCATFRKNR